MIHLLVKILFVVTCFALIGIVLIQRARGGGLAGAFGGTSETFLGGVSSELVKWTAYLAGAFLLFALFLDFVPPQRSTIDTEAISGVGVPAVGPGQTEVDPDAPIVMDDELPPPPPQTEGEASP